MPDARSRLDAAAERSAAPGPVSAVLLRLTDEQPDAVERLFDGEGLSSLGRAVVAVAGASDVLARLCLTDPVALDVLGSLEIPSPWSATDVAALARSKRLAVLRIAGRDLLELDRLDDVASALADLAARVLDDAVALAGGGGAGDETLAVIGMGKLGGRELNYASDVDVLFVSGDGDDGGMARRVLEVARHCFRVDADLRPEGRAGPLARPLDSYVSYWGRWASTWEFQALLKARPVAGSAALGRRFDGAAAEALWGRGYSADELAELRAMKARTEQLVTRRGLGDRELKRGPGGIRDIEFAVQLLQLVHGGYDPAIRTPSTLGALAELRGAGYVSAEDADELASHYRFLRTVEHRLQLVEEEQTHAVPTAEAARRRLARVLGFEDDARAKALDRFDNELHRRQNAVRAIHERLFFRPLLEAFSGAGPPMDRAAIDRRLAAFGFGDAKRTASAVDELIRGLTRSSRLMAQFLPLLLDWLSLTPDPDLGLLGLRNLALQRHQRSIMVNSFRESPEAARRLCVLLGSSRALGEAVERNPELIAQLDDDEALRPGQRQTLVADAEARMVRARDDDERRAQMVRLRQDQFVRVAARDLLELDTVEETGASLSDTAEVLLEAALSQVSPGGGFCVIGMGRLGGAELAYASDLDVLLVGDDDVAGALLHLMHGPSPAHRVATIDLGLRPEGAQGRLSRSVDGYEAYFSRWAATWERQALVRARVVAGDRAVGADFLAVATPFVWGQPFGEAEVAEIRRMKARMERERIPTRDDPQFHLKLGRGSLSDVEWTVQLLQLRHGVAATSTMEGLRLLMEAGAVSAGDGDVLRQSYVFCERTRNRLHLVGSLGGGAHSGDALPAQAHQMSRLARSLQTTPSALRDEYRRVTRRARRVMERLFYGVEAP
ncbi:MAG TPA: bifunctional [glutamine synthetase] adenylyltransferase/[glutamine synthetase]-adenylyl-L-tyrosine phosphorylase [Acidimicrobiales bacterium]|nr:bifunctional [glutamine synthetase] adenylyltransferase/[glutamine synthetase]-adenylyl-L-tyrosine phosphorylase [Acidimicrobiales bacterium]